MAGEWIKMRTNLWNDPRVSRLCDLTDQPEAMIIGGLYWLWAMADEHSEDGFLPELTLRSIDRKTGVKGLGQALIDIGWMVELEDGLQVANFDEHNGASAKRRTMDAKRKANVRKVSACDADKKRTPTGARERVRVREDLNPTHTPRVDDSDSAEPDPEPPGPNTPLEINLDWQPHPDDLKAYAVRAGLTLDVFTPEAVAPFVLYHEPRGQLRTRREWASALVRWVQGDRVRAARVVPIRPKASGDYDDHASGWLGE